MSLELNIEELKKELEKKPWLIEDLKKGPWPGFITEYETMAAKKEITKRMMCQLELSYRKRTTLWKHGGAVTVKGYGGGVIGRYSMIPEIGPPAGSHTFRVNQPAGWFYKTDKLRAICDVWEKYGSGLMNLHGSTGDIILLGVDSPQVQECFEKLLDVGYDLGGSGSVLRSLSCCKGPALCEWAMIDTLDIYHDLTMTYQDYLHRPHWPYKFKIKISGCPNDCVAAKGRADLAIIGTWRDEIQIDQEEVRNYVKNGLDIEHIVKNCPTKAMSWDGNELKIDNKECVRCMYCINRMPKALRPGKDRGATLLLGGKATILHTAFIGWVIVPFMKLEKPYKELKELLQKMWDWWDEHGRYRERIGELVYRLGMNEFLRAVGLPAVPQMVWHPRNNPYIFWRPEELE